MTKTFPSVDVADLLQRLGPVQAREMPAWSRTVLVADLDAVDRSDPGRWRLRERDALPLI